MRNKKSKLRLAHLDSNRKLNSKPDLFSSIFLIWVLLLLLRFHFLHFLQGKNAQNRPENQQNWNLAKNGLKSDNFMKWKPLQQYLGNVWTIKVVLEFWFCHQKCHFFLSQKWALLAKRQFTVYDAEIFLWTHTTQGPEWLKGLS